MEPKVGRENSCALEHTTHAFPVTWEYSSSLWSATEHIPLLVYQLFPLGMSTLVPSAWFQVLEIEVPIFH